MNKIKERALDIVVEGAGDLFLEKSISSVTMEEIARYVGLGAASMYRYFGTKQALAVRVAVLFAQNIYQEYFSNLTGETGYEKICSFYEAYRRIFEERREYFRFIREFDLLYLADAKEGKGDYESEIDRFLTEYQEFYTAGLADGSVKAVEDVKIFYLSSTHALLNLCKALTSERALLSQDGQGREVDEIQTLIDIFLFRLRAEER